jgi:hypothetical protein
VRHADDLLPVLDDTSAAARSARRSADARTKKHGWLAVGIAATLVGTALMLVGNHEQDDDPDAGGGKFKAGMGIAILGGTIGVVASFSYLHTEHAERNAAFANYDDGLRARLSLCVDGLQLVGSNPLRTGASQREQTRSPPSAPRWCRRRQHEGQRRDDGGPRQERHQRAQPEQGAAATQCSLTSNQRAIFSARSGRRRWRAAPRRARAWAGQPASRASSSSAAGAGSGIISTARGW